MEPEIHPAVLKLIIRYGSALARIASQSTQDKSNNLRQNEVFRWRETLVVLEELREYATAVPWTDLTDLELLLLGFRLWREDHPLRLVPAHLWKFLPSGLKLTAIDGEEILLGTGEVDPTTALGCMAYGWIGKDRRGETHDSKPV